MTTKEKVLQILTENQEKPVSGQTLAETCGVSRAAIWKAVTTLREQGCSIEGTTNGGYILSGNADIFSLEILTQEIQKNFPSLSGCHIEAFAQIDSTNSYAKRLLSETGNLRLMDGSLTDAGKKFHNSIFVAESQTQGRGRLGRTFYSPGKTGIYITVIYAPKGGITNPARITAFTAVAACRAIKTLFNIEPGIKWINDLFYKKRKIAGILAEGSANFETGVIEAAVIGIGINIQDNPEIFQNTAKEVAGSLLQNENNSSITRCQLAALVAGNILTIMEENPEAVMQEYKASSFLTGTTVQVHPVIGNEKEVYSAKVIDIDNNAGLVVQLEDGSTRTLNSGEVSLHSDLIV